MPAPPGQRERTQLELAFFGQRFDHVQREGTDTRARADEGGGVERDADGLSRAHGATA
jgi:hypothetical protein